MKKINNIFFKLLLYLLVLCWSLGQIGRIQIGELPTYIYLFELILILFIIQIFVTLAKERLIQKIKIPFTFKLFFSWLVITFLISLFSYNLFQNFIAFLYLMRMVVYVLFFFLLSTLLKSKPVLKKTVFMALLVSAIITLAFTLVQYFLYPNLGNLAYLGWDPHLNRLVGLFFDPPLTVSIIVLFGLYFYLVSSVKILKLFILLITIILSYLTYSRGGYLGIISIITVYTARFLNKYLIALTLIMLFLGAALSTRSNNESQNLLRTTSIEARLNDYNKAFKIWKKSPILGIGYNHIREEKDKYSEELITEKYNPSHGSASFHSSFLIILVTTGAIGFALFSICILSFAKLNQFTLLSTIFISVISIFDNVMLHPLVMLLYILIYASFEESTHVQSGQ